jgi:hypothetical protein
MTRELLAAIRSGTHGPVFVKPRASEKLVTGHVLADVRDLTHAQGHGGGTGLWGNEVVTWCDEERAFVQGGVVVDARSCVDGGARDDLAVARDAIATWRTEGTMPRACAMDFGLLADGQTALVEANDAFGVGAYGLDPGT